MLAAVKPGGWLMLEEPDYICAAPDSSMTATATALSQKGWAALFAQLKARGYDTEFGRHLYHDLSVHQLDELQAEGFVAMQVGGQPSARVWRLTFEQMMEQVIEAGLLTARESDDYRALLESPGYRWLEPMMMTAWGRRPRA